MIDPGRLCRMDAALVARIARGERLGALALGAAAILFAGAGAYGFAFGIWRAPEQALYSAIKLPLLLLAVVLVTTCVNAMLALVLRAPLGVRQSAVCLLLGLATTAAILGALSPISTCLALTVRPPDPSVLGLALDDPRADAANRAAQALLLYHVAVIAIAGVLGNLRLFALLRALCGRREIALRVLFAWLAAELLVGSELSWWFGPFLARPHLAPSFWSDEAFESSFFEEIALALGHSLGAPGLAVGGGFLLVFAATLVLLLRPDGLRVEIDATARGLAVVAEEARFFVGWEHVVSLARREAVVLFEDSHEVVIEVTHGPARRLIVRVAARDEADALHARCAALRDRRDGPGPFRRPDPAAPRTA